MQSNHRTVTLSVVNNAANRSVGRRIHSPLRSCRPQTYHVRQHPCPTRPSRQFNYCDIVLWSKQHI